MGDADMADQAFFLPLAQRREMGLGVDQIMDLHQFQMIGKQQPHRLHHLVDARLPARGPDLGGDKGAVAQPEIAQQIAGHGFGVSIHERGIDYRTAGIEQQTQNFP